ncbi:putative bifunctional diguanylate cyclase/phosphodiesterase [Roseateles depolymerans]|uniref:Diguanylate cyclase n=1 Tax=Roseateles depolymerans TaxID=76731 RepID=A0A0U3MJL2_9BURK|nr:bifunctional diguanylate cyclase/phosphodiesterase [Roseateles depolymerans]ALV08909.1 diguanylate cyclase [Roseateles depolymerans]REG09429.1 PAS domain S-box-containing protein/diguanylate cyclase (GGDEF)-like protein [Roseateles depolymerans]
MKPVRPARGAAQAPEGPSDLVSPAVLLNPSFLRLIDGLQEAVWLVCARTHAVVAVNAASQALLGLDARDLVGSQIESLAATPEDALFWMDAAIGRREPLHTDTMMRHADGRMLWVSRRISHVPQPEGHGLWLVAMRDQTQQRHHDEERETLLAELRATLESTADGILVTDLAGRIRSFNQRLASLWGIPEDLLNERNDDAVQAWMRRSVVDGQGYAMRLTAIQESPLLHTSDNIKLIDGRVMERVSLPQWSRGRPIGRVYSFRDLSEKLAARQRIEELSHNDMLTSLPNRRALLERVDYAQAMARREASPFALLNVDLDRFKQINDTLGHSYGDRVIKEVAVRLKESLREVDTVARLDGDEFALLIHQADARGAEHAARRVQEAMSRPFSFDTLSFTVTCSIGIALFPGDGASADDLLASAERAMHWVKESGRSAFRFHQPRKDVDLLSRMRLDHAMRRALQEGEFRLHFQPQIAVDSGALIGAEALIRWRDPHRGDVPPSEFIPVAEESGFIIAIGQWVLQQAVAQAADWLKKGLRVPVAVNVSALQFQQPQFVDTVAQTLRAAQLPPDLLELELTESVLLRDADEALHRMQALSELGLQLAIDDFGTGYSSLGYLKRFPIQRLKVDRSFVKGLPGDASDEGIVNAIVQMGRALKLQVIAEGVETEDQLAFLARCGCQEYQGFLCAPALDPRSFEHRFKPADAIGTPPAAHASAKPVPVSAAEPVAGPSKPTVRLVRGA